ncbi:MAG: lysine biosynthesis protein LysX [Sulfolobaceae archaeon]
MNLGVIYDMLRWEEKDIIAQAKRLGHNVNLVYLKSFSFSSKLSNVFLGSNVFIQRSVSHSRALISSVLFENLGLKVINSYETLFKSYNKFFTSLILRKNKIPTPDFAISFDKENALKVAEDLGYPVVIKPIEGSWGRMVARAYDKYNLLDLMEYQDYTVSNFRTIYYIQKYVNKPNRDIRIFTIGDEAPVGIYRVNYSNWKTNTALGAKAEPLKIDKELEELALKVKDTIGGLFLGIDIFEDRENGYLVNEVNPVPEFKNTVRVTNYNISEKLIKCIEVELKR